MSGIGAGIYDNRRTFCREYWRDGRRLGYVSALLIQDDAMGYLREMWGEAFTEPWGFYLDSPENVYGALEDGGNAESG